MSILGNISNIFNPPAAAPVVPATTVPAQPGQLPATGAVGTETPGAAPNGVLPDPTVTGAPPVDSSPLDQFKDLWENVPNDPNNPAADTALPQLNQEDVQKVVGKIDFSQSLTPEALSAITAGGEEAVTALAQVLNTVGQQSLAHSTLVSNKLSQQMVEKALANQTASLPDLIRSATVTSHLKDSNPVFTNPALKPVLEATQSQLEGKFPNATPAEIGTMLNQYMTAMASEFSPQAPTVGVPGETDWSKYLQ